MALSQTLTILATTVAVGMIVAGIFFIYLRGRRKNVATSDDILARLRRRISSRSLPVSSPPQESRDATGATASSFGTGLYDGSRTPPWPSGLEREDLRSLSTLYRRLGKRQGVAGVCFVIASISFLILSVRYGSVVLEIDSVVSFAVAAILFLKDTKSRVQPRVLSAIVLSLGTTIAKLSSRVGSRFVYVPMGKGVSDIAVVVSPEGLDNPLPRDEFRLVPPGMGLAVLFSRESDGTELTSESLDYLVPSILKENFNLAEAVEVNSAGTRVEVVLHKPTLFCSCQKDETKISGVVGCTVSSFLAVLYSHGNQRSISLNRCVTDAETGEWNISMNFLSNLA